VGAVRKEIGVRTIFNLLGPLSNPSNPEYQVTGVAKKELGPIFADVFVEQGKRRALVIHSSEGMNEVSPEAETYAWLVKDGAVEPQTLTPTSFGLESVPVASAGILGGTAEERAVLLRNVLSGEQCPLRTFLVINAACALWVAEKASDLKEAAAMAEELIDSGKALAKLEEYVAATQSAAAKRQKTA